MTRLTVRLLGPFEVRLGDDLMTEFAYDKVRALLAFLVTETSHPHRRETLTGLLWPDLPERSARQNLRQALFTLRNALGDPADPTGASQFLDATYQTIELDRASDHWLDVAAFDAAIRASEAHLHPELSACEACLGRLNAASELYRGDFLEDLSLPDSVPFEEWALFQRERLRRRMLETLEQLSASCLARDEATRALAYARRQLALDPVREPAHRQVMQALAWGGQRTAAVAQYEACKEALFTDLGIEPEPATVALYDRIRNGTFPPAAVPHEAPAGRGLHPVGACPYRGLAAFEESDARFFFGRDAFVDRLVHAVTLQPPVAVVVGASGSGKSSVVLAGLLPRLRERGGWVIASLRPGREPFEALAGALVRHLEPHADDARRSRQARGLADLLAGGEIQLVDVALRIRERHRDQVRLLLLVDQLEELYTLCTDPDVRLRFIDTLLGTVRAAEEIGRGARPLALVATLRADFTGQALAHRPLAEILQVASQMLPPMTREELRAAIEKPAATQGAVFEAGLVARLLDDVAAAPGSLPLLEFALTLVWDQLEGGWLTHAAYEAIGRVEGALARYAQDVYESLPPQDRALCRRVFTQLVQPGEGTEDTRRLAVRADVGETAWELVQHLADRRLVVTGRDQTTGTETVEVVHEALIRNWGRLQAWLDEDRAFRTWQERLRVLVRTWKDSDRDEGALLRGLPLAEAEEWLASRAGDLSDDDRGFVETGIALRAAQRKAELEAASQLTEARDRALREREVALHQAAIGLASEARLQMEGPDQDLAALLALEAVEHYPYTWQAELALAEIVLGWRLAMQFPHGVPVPSAPQVSPDGARFLTASNDGVLRVWDLADGRNLLTVQAYQGVAANWHWAFWAPSGDRILTHAFGGGRPRVWDVTSGRLLAECSGGGGCAARWSPDGLRVLSSAREEIATIWDARTGERLHELLGTKGIDASFSPNGRRIVTARGQIWDAETSELAHTLGAYQELIAQGERPWFAWSPDGTRVGTGMAGTARVWDAATGDEVLVLSTGYRGKADLWWSPDGTRLLITGYTGDNSQAALWDAVTGGKLRELPFTDECGPTSPWSPQGDRIAVSDAQGHVIVWEAGSGTEVLRIRAQGDRPYVTWLPDGGGFITAGSYDELARVWRIATPGVSLSRAPDCPPDTWEGPNIAAWSPDGTRVARPFDDGSVQIWEVASQRETARITRGSPRPGIAINWVVWSPDSSRIVTGGGEGGVEIWDSATGVRLLALAGHGDVALDDHWSVGHVVMGLAWSPDGRRVLSCGRDHRAVVWDTTTGDALVEFVGREYHDGAWSPDGQRIVLVDLFGYGGTVRIWSPHTGEALLTLLPDDFGYGTSTVAWSPDGTQIVTFSLDGVGRLWEAETGALLGTVAAAAWNTCAQWSASGKRFAVGGASDGVRVWDAATLEMVARYPTAPGNSAGTWAPDGKAIAIGYANGDTKVFPAWQSLEELVAYAKAHCALRELTPEERQTYGLPQASSR